MKTKDPHGKVWLVKETNNITVIPWSPDGYREEQGIIKAHKRICLIEQE